MLWQRVISSVFIVLLTLGPAILGRSVFALVVLGIFSLIMHEFMSLLQSAGHQPVALVGFLILFTAIIAIILVGWSNWGMGIIIAAILLPLLVILFRRDHQGALVDWAVTTAATLYVVIPAIHFILLRDLHGEASAFMNQIDETGKWQSPSGSPTTAGLAWYLLAQLVTWLTDVGAYTVGRTLGRHKLAPLVSPAKSIEGTVGGLVLGAITAAICVHYFGLPLSLPWAIVVGLVLSACGQLGDLFESLLKRQAGVKDSGTLIPGHGGVFDRLDSLLVVATITYYLAQYIH